jgi:hypothetical protein
MGTVLSYSDSEFFKEVSACSRYGQPSDDQGNAEGPIKLEDGLW